MKYVSTYLKQIKEIITVAAITTMLSMASDVQLASSIVVDTLPNPFGHAV